MIIENISVIPLATNTGTLVLNKPYKNQKRVPVAKREYIDREILLVFFVLIVLIAWGEMKQSLKLLQEIPKY